MLRFSTRSPVSAPSRGGLASCLQSEQGSERDGLLKRAAGVQALVPAGPAQAWLRDSLGSLLIVLPIEVALEPPCPPNDPKPPGQGHQAKFLEVHVSVSVSV